MTAHIKFAFFFFPALVSCSLSFGQDLNNDSLGDIQLKNAINVYYQYDRNNAPIYNGSQYIFYTFKKEGDPFFITGEYSDGWVSYAGRLYKPLHLIYDIERNMIVIKGENGVTNIILQNELIDSFNLLNHTFLSLKEDHKQNLYTSGFFDLLHNGKIKLLSKRLKKMDDVIEGNQVVRRFSSVNKFFIFKEGLYYLVSSKKDVLRVLSDKKTDLRREMRKNNIKIKRKNFEETLLRTVKLYDQLT